MRTNQCKLMKPVATINVDAELIADKIQPLNKSGKLNVIKCIFGNMRTLANTLMETRTDVARAVNAILTGDSMDLTRLGRKVVCCLIQDTIIPLGYDDVPNGGFLMFYYDNATGECGIPGHDSFTPVTNDNVYVTRVEANMPIDYCDYSDAQLMNVINHLFINIRALATTMEAVRPDITAALDAIATDFKNPSVEIEIRMLTNYALLKSLRPAPDVVQMSPILMYLDRDTNHFKAMFLWNGNDEMDEYDFTFNSGTDAFIVETFINKAKKGYFIGNGKCMIGEEPAIEINQKIVDKFHKKPCLLLVKGNV